MTLNNILRHENIDSIRIQQSNKFQIESIEIKYNNKM